MYMDAKSAFDMVRIDGLLYKLHYMGVGGKTLRVIANSFQGSSSRVLQNGYFSESFHIKQGTRQGSICALFFYTVYINDLLAKLQESQHGLRIGNLRLSAPTQADDIVFLLSLSGHGLNYLLSICYSYANTWRYLYNPSKCTASVMRRKKVHSSAPPPAKYGNTLIPETDIYKHQT